MIRNFLKIALLAISWQLVATDYVLTYPKSGTHWFLYSLSYLTKRDAFGDQRFSSLIEVDPDLPILEHLHIFRDPNALDDERGFQKEDRMILLLRDFKEALPRTHHENYDRILSLVRSKEEDYLANLEAFDRLPQECRLVLYYEDLCLFPEKTLRQALQFLKEDESRLSHFIENLSFHRWQSLSFYNQHETYGGTQSKGEDFRFHQKRSPQEFNQALEELFLELAPDLSKKYLARYFSKPFDNWCN